MSNSTIVWLVIIILVLVAGGWFFFYSGSMPGTAPTENTAATDGEDDSGAGVGVGVDVSVGGAPQSATVTYSANGFTPTEVRIAKGGTVTFVDENPNGDMWVASASHPTHSVYSGTTLQQHCDTMSNDSFDQCQSGATYSFSFDKTGTWGYHNHVQSSHFGRVIVE